MYKVFINTHLIQLSEKEEDIGKFSSILTFSKADQEDIIMLFEWLLKEKSTFLIQLLYDDLEEGWSQFKSCFDYLEAAGGLVRNSEGDLLMIYRLGKWDLPKGKIEKNESAIEAALREVEEECGIKNLLINEEHPSTYHIYQQKNRMILKRTYWYGMSSDFNQSFTPQLDEGIEKVEWMSASKVEEAKNFTYDSLKDLLT